MVDSIFEISILERDVVGICRRGGGGGARFECMRLNRISNTAFYLFYQLFTEDVAQ